MFRKMCEPLKDKRLEEEINNSELHNLYSSSNVVRIIKAKRSCSPLGGYEKCVQSLVGKP
jgi:hypothetical protein